MFKQYQSTGMRKKFMNVSLFIIITLSTIDGLYGQETLFELYRRKTDTGKVEFTNASVLFKENNKQWQQIIASHTAMNPGKIIFSTGGKELLRKDLIKGNNRFLLTLAAVTSAKNITISVRINNGPSKQYPFTLVPPKKWSIYFVQHTHTDIGFTHPQSEVLAEQMRNIDYALDYCDQTDSLPDEAKFRWTCESAWVTREWLRSRPSQQVERLKKRISEGRIEVTGMYFNMAEISDENIMFDFLQPLKEFRRSGIPVKTAMQDDVNGIAWCMPDYFKNTGVRYLSMGINETRSILPFDKPTPFWWESPSGERMLAFRSEHYMTGNFFNIETAASSFPEKMLWYLAHLESKKYPYDRIAIQFSGYFTDNSPPSILVCDLIRKWNEKYEYPKLKLSVVSEYMEYIEKNHAKELPVFRNAWLDWWTDGFASTSRETAEIRKTQNLKQVTEGLLAMVTGLGGELSSSTENKIDHISENALFFDEHTVGADESISRPFSENSTRQWLQKGAYAWEAVKKATLLNEEALSRLQEFLKKSDQPLVYIVNPMGWNRSGAVQVFIDYSIFPLDKNARITDLVTGKEITAQLLKKRPEGAYWMLEVNDIPAMGYKAFKIEKQNGAISTEILNRSAAETLENRFYKVTVDKQTGAINSLFDKEMNLELVNGSEKWKLGQAVRETLPKRDKNTPSYATVSAVKIDTGSNGQVWESIRILSDITGFEKGQPNMPKGIELELRLYRNVKKIEFKYMARKELLTAPEALYIAFPFLLPDSRIVFETTGGILSQGQQLPGSSSDWNVAQNFVSVRSSKGQIILISNELPLWQFSDLNIGKFERYPKPGKPTLYSWVMNNYWFTNFRAAQEGAFSWSYQLSSTTDTTNTYATKYAWNERNMFATRVLHAGQNELKSASTSALKIGGSPNILLVNSRPAFKGKNTVLLHFRELEGKDATIELSSDIEGHQVRKITEVNAIGEKIGGEVKSIKLKPYEVKFVEVEL